MKPTSNDSYTNCLIEEEVLEYVKYNALLIAQKTEDCICMQREGLQYIL